MGYQIIKQPNKLYGIYSSFGDGIILYNAREQDVFDFFVEEAVKSARENVQKILDKIESDEKPYYQFTMSWDEAIETHAKEYGEDSAQEIQEKAAKYT